ncbi:hypothetical protein [Acaryochloris sp. IP29b_bin.137]|uniref:hypothetical protein n=1 Tax=Acaryochloris sp. IP29b_bin.137 TaxID=2969217 RepID=UPI0026330D9E|nr:hypothetical protein [Acaryochloris sp. IP29b_bin.137]
MPDGDIVHSGLGRLYKKPYEWLCEGKATSEECARTPLAALKKDIIRKGNLPVRLSQYMAERLIQTVNAIGDISAVNWTAVNTAFDQIAQQTHGSHALKELTLRAAKSFLHDLRYGQETTISNAPTAILKGFFHEVYESEFKDRIPLTPTHHAGVDPTILDQRIGNIEPTIFTAIQKWANKAVHDGSVKNIRLPRREKIKEIDLNENIGW